MSAKSLRFVASEEDLGHVIRALENADLPHHRWRMVGFEIFLRDPDATWEGLLPELPESAQRLPDVPKNLGEPDVQ